MSGCLWFRYSTEPTTGPKFWLDLLDLPDLDRARWRDPGDSVRRRMRLTGRIADIHMTLVLRPPSLARPPCPSGGTAGGVVAEGDPELEPQRFRRMLGSGFGDRSGVPQGDSRLSEEGDAKRMKR